MTQKAGKIVTIRSYRSTAARLEMGERIAMTDEEKIKQVFYQYEDGGLISIAAILKDAFGPSAITGRLGGDEFGVFIKNAPERELLRLKISDMLQKMRLIELRKEEDITVTCSVGAVVCDRICEPEQIYRNVDEALYHSKHSGKNGFSFYGQR